MSQPRFPFTTLPRGAVPTMPATLPAALAEELTALYGLAQGASHVFASPLGPFQHASRSHHLPRFVYVGPQTFEESPRLAFLAGLDHRDLRSTLALLAYVRSLAQQPGVGPGLFLAFFPFVDLLGLAGLTTGRALDTAHWGQGHTAAPELQLLEQDARACTYHGFVRVETVLGATQLVIRQHGLAGLTDLFRDDGLFAGEVPVAWHSEPAGTVPTGGPLTVADDLPLTPFALTVQVPAAWEGPVLHVAVARVLTHVIVRYRSVLAYAQHL